ncbi:MAG: fatty acid desaturase family protein [Roseibium sp.]|uniref:fatty acid desaturase family protein n=1 Tax=Roseibium sp. TaxID=1936156 RepID=UPI0026076AE8|nr:fatty acid desaturase family protein [Roseibium sp.]MCV0425200.1 fatty acid desaturase family protein [Roseibium sp.]
MTRDYSLNGEAARLAVRDGIANPTWYRPRIDPKEILKLREKSDAIALRDTLLWLGLMVLSCGIAIWLWPSWWSAPFWLVYGVLYGSASDSRWHECGHKTAFKTAWMNAAVYQIASFMLMRNPVVWRASHVRHHTDTIIVGRDPEIVAMRPPDLFRIALNLFGIADTRQLLGRMFLHVSGRLHPDEREYVKEGDQSKVFLVARIWLLIYLMTITLCFWLGSILPLMVIGLPRLFGAWHHVLTGLLQHLGLAENVTDHRLNTRTVLMNPISRFIYLNMNYHLEHHLFTMVPYYHLPKLHELIKHDVPPPEPSILAAFRRLVPVLVKQLRYEDAVIVPKLPEGATPYREEVERLRPHAVQDSRSMIGRQ